MADVERKGELEVLHVVIVIALAVLMLLVIIPVVAGASKIVASKGCTIAYQILNSLHSVISSEPLADFC